MKSKALATSGSESRRSLIRLYVMVNIIILLSFSSEWSINPPESNRASGEWQNIGPSTLLIDVGGGSLLSVDFAQDVVSHSICVSVTGQSAGTVEGLEYSRFVAFTLAALLPNYRFLLANWGRIFDSKTATLPQLFLVPFSRTAAYFLLLTLHLSFVMPGGISAYSADAPSDERSEASWREGVRIAARRRTISITLSKSYRQLVLLTPVSESLTMNYILSN